MNIGIFADAYLPTKNGMVTSINQLKTSLEAQGHNVYIFTVSAKNAPKMNGVYRSFSIPISRKNEGRLSIVNYRKTKKIVEELKLDLIHTHSEFAIGLAGKKIAKALNIPLIHTCHTLWQYYKHYIMGGLFFKVVSVETILRKFLQGYKYIVTPSIKAKKYFINLSDKEAIYEIVPNGIDEDKFLQKLPTISDINEVKKIYKIKEGDKIAIFVGRLGPEKRVIELVNAWMPQLKKNDSYKLIIVGDGPSFKEIKQIVETNKLTDKIILPGYVLWEKISLYYKISTVNVSVSLSETSSMTGIESLIQGLPIVVRQDDAFAEIVEEGINGFYAKTDEELVTKTIEIFNNSSLRTKLSDNSKVISKKFSADNHGKKMLAFYKLILTKENKDFKR
jgi:glycosyltransferase involved in cell wall biosynthesis